MVWLSEEKEEVDTNCSIRAIRNYVFIFTSHLGLLIKRRLMRLGGALQDNEVFTVVWAVAAVL